MSEAARRRIVTATLNGQRQSATVNLSSFAEYPVSSGGYPYAITAGADGALWFTYTSASQVGRITTAGSARCVPGRRIKLQPITAGPDGALWLTLNAQQQHREYEHQRGCHPVSITDRAWRAFRSHRHHCRTGWGTVVCHVQRRQPWPGRHRANFHHRVYYHTRCPRRTSRVASPNNITAGPDGALWFTFSSGYGIGRMTTSGVFSSYQVKALSGGATGFGGITAGPDGALWFTETATGAVASITTAGAINQYALLPSSFIPRTITSGPDGALWVVGGLLSTEIFRITTTGEITNYSDSVAGDGNYSGITTGPDGALWVTGSRGDVDAVFSVALNTNECFL